MHRSGLVRLATLLCGSAAEGEDAVQNVLVRVYRRWDKLVATDPNVLAYVRRAVTNEHVSWRRRWHTRHIRLVDQDELTVAAGAAPGPTAHDDELWDQVLRLPERQRAAVVLRYYEGLSDAEIAEVLACAQPTVRAHVSRGLGRLQEMRETERGVHD
jgi:RNA polymerase sigma factor (sigma-70 family)